MHIQQDISTYYNGNVETLKGRNDPESIKTVAKEIEALFAYELIKAMRKTANTESEEGLGRDTYMSIFDMEIAKLFSERGVGLKDVMLKGMNRIIEKSRVSNQNTQEKTQDLRLHKHEEESKNHHVSTIRNTSELQTAQAKPRQMPEAEYSTGAINPNNISKSKRDELGQRDEIKEIL